MTWDEISYFRRRELQERAAAKSATSLAARRVHQQLAQFYAAMLDRADGSHVVHSLRSCGAL